ncbi:hypothetical protein D9615_007586 [Tricholomella constricta]|uniref:DUF6570 domain-containing protein n=1 Tax=Tricholomella constricta TaxID=117010 RepID=A0A8H5H7E7_9AGAR|nr:hypothetical protein D9615_007586 [Tricholomella constricta]
MHFNLLCAACITPAEVNKHGPWFNVGRLKSMPNTANNKQEPPNDTFVCYDTAVGTPCVICYACAENAGDYTIVPPSYDAIAKDVPAVMHKLSGAETALITLVFHVGTCISVKGEVTSITAQLLPLQFHGSFTPAKLPLSYEELRLVLTITTELVDGFISTDEICVRRDKVQRALEWLTSHSEAYKNVDIDWERITNLPIANELPDIETYNVRPFVTNHLVSIQPQVLSDPCDYPTSPTLLLVHPEDFGLSTRMLHYDKFTRAVPIAFRVYFLLSPSSTSNTSVFMAPPPKRKPARSASRATSPPSKEDLPASASSDLQANPSSSTTPPSTAYTTDASNGTSLAPPSRSASGAPLFSYDDSLIWSIAADLGWPAAADSHHIRRFLRNNPSLIPMPPLRAMSPYITKLAVEHTAKLFRSPARSPNAGIRSISNPKSWRNPPSLQARVDQAILNAWRPSTSVGYSRAVRQFFDFCNLNNVPPSACIPASEDLLCAFAASFGGTHAGSTIRAKCSALRAWHIQNSLPWLGGTQLAYVIKGCANMRPVPSQSKRAAFSLMTLVQLLNTLDRSSPLDVCVAFIASAAFWGQLRLGEILPNHLRALNANGSRMLHLPRTKTCGNLGEDVILTRQSEANPVTLLKRHFTLNCPKSLSSPLASYLSSNGALVILSKRRFLACCNEVFSARKLPTISGHCFRISGTTHLLLAGVPPDIVKVMGRWSSDAFLRYWRSLELIAPIHAELLAPLVLDRTRA